MSDRHELQSAGTHPAPCARHCESTAYEIEIRRLRHDIERHVGIATEATQEAEQLRTELAVSREREARMRALIADDSYAMTFQSFGQYRTALLRELAEGAQLPVHQPVHQPVHDWEHTARLLDAALQELIVFVDDRWGDNECRPLENAKHALGLVKDEQ